ncbi:Hypothetical_protein [Hexamita inflata]|uniref:Hypothetical_protein n=1 Tax=Hexamita inflata TaxID=28002 RepID=A0AA86NJH4_9EUKA|nr:Hypothetical protein HINF_LOCUS8045 [Hexamita inflata]CAI9966642.1 Hypothetical protein HINF_LOCUS54287 [Hexamita inflata]
MKLAQFVTNHPSIRFVPKDLLYYKSIVEFEPLYTIILQDPPFVVILKPDIVVLNIFSVEDFTLVMNPAPLVNRARSDAQKPIIFEFNIQTFDQYASQMNPEISQDVSLSFKSVIVQLSIKTVAFAMLLIIELYDVEETTVEFLIQTLILFISYQILWLQNSIHLYQIQ